jgi:hypothetical protein
VREGQRSTPKSRGNRSFGSDAARVLRGLDEGDDRWVQWGPLSDFFF